MGTKQQLKALQKKVAQVRALMADIGGAIDSGALAPHSELLKNDFGAAFDAIEELTNAVEEAQEEEGRLNGEVGV